MNSNLIKEIDIRDIKGFKIGNAQDYNAMTGVTTIIFEKENRAGIDISGGGPASRESHLLHPLTNPHSLNAIVLSGGSAYGLNASSGVVKYLEENNIGYKLMDFVIPLVTQSCIFDLNIGDKNIRPDTEMAYKSCIDSKNNNAISGIIGAGTGAIVGKLAGLNRAQKSGIGYYAISLGDLQIGALAVVNAVGDIFNYRTGEKIAGVLDKNREKFSSIEDEMYLSYLSESMENTTLGVVFTNAKFNQAQMSKVASMTRAGFARSINPVSTMADGDTIYAVSLGDIIADINLVGALSANVMSRAIEDAINSSSMEDIEFLEKIIY